MSASVLASCLWVLAATATAMLPMRHQMVPGLALLVSAPVLMVWLALSVGWWMGVLGLLAFLSMFRRPLGALVGWLLRRGGWA
ncbi:DUF2484 family protein [Rubellimicrobium roseum]|uniref:DUF2484 family protein n=1 Tax=Rubellimicrobium roseum TaxID=687525 RepID=A0A5C4NI73_9RHOB|nr:DUF2484 family protein [Rubellimicrobium roseum]TNC73812.1 DUF2484 family protein [Rubellimicrobium roseum]